MKRKTGAEIIAFVLGQDYADMADNRYQAGRTGNVAVYTVGDDYYCCPTMKQKLPTGFNKWRAIATEYGRVVYKSNGGIEL